MAFGLRLKAAMFAAGIPAADMLASRVGVSPQVIRKWLRDTTPRLNAENIVSLSQTLNVRVLWLANGRGPIHSFTAGEYTEPELLGAFRTLGKKEQVLLRDFIGLLMRHQAD